MVACGCAYRDINFKITKAGQKEKVGVIAKKFQAGAGELASEMDRFGLDFPDDADPQMKIVLTAACFLIDYLYFEGDDGDDDDEMGE